MRTELLISDRYLGNKISTLNERQNGKNELRLK